MEDTSWAAPWGARPAGLAHRVLRDGRGGARRAVRDPRRRQRPDLPAPRERGGADAGRPRPAARADLDAQRDARDGRREDGQVRRQHPRPGRGARRGRARRRADAVRRRATTASRSSSRPRSSRTPRAGWSGSANAGRRLVPGDSPAELAPHRDAFFDALADDYNTPRALAALAEWIREANRAEGARRRLGQLREMLAVLGLENLLDVDAPARRRRSSRWPSARAAARAARDFAEADRLRDELRARGLGGARRRRRPRARPARPVIVYGRNAVREAIRGPAAACARCGPQGRGGRVPAAPGSRARRQIAQRCGSDAHQGVCADVEAYRYADAAALLRAARPGARGARRGDRPAEPRRGLPHGRVHAARRG